MVRRLGLGKNNHLTYTSLALNPRNEPIAYVSFYNMHSPHMGDPTRSDKQIERKILHVICIWIFFFFLSSRILLCLKALVEIGFTVFALYVEVGKGRHRL